jgi:hypothetical protein
MTPRKSVLLPRPGDAYRAYGHYGTTPGRVVHFVTSDYGREGFDYADLKRLRLVPGDKPGGSDVLTLRFNSSVITEVVIEGRHLLSVCQSLGRHLVAWMWEHPSPAQFADNNATVISRITIDDVER